MRWFDLRSFGLGVLSAALIFWILLKNRSGLRNVRSMFTQKAKETSKKDDKSIDHILRAEIYRQTQHQHLAASLAPLDELLVPPQIVAYPFVDADQLGDPPIVDQMIPYLPDQPELSGMYDVQGIPLVNMLKTPLHLVLTAPLGGGKTTSLAHLTALMVRNQTGIKRLEGVLPVMVDITEALLLRTDTIPLEENFLKPLVDSFPAVIRSKINNQLLNYLKSNRILLLCDGLDELDPDQFELAAQLIQQFIKKYPQVRWLCAATPQYFGRLPQLGFSPVYLKQWNAKEKKILLTRWVKLWIQHNLFPNEAEKNAFYIMLAQWFLNDHRSLSPMEWTLRLWALLSGDTTGDNLTNDIASYFRRISDGDISYKAMEALASLFIRQKTTYLPQTTLEMMLVKNSFTLGKSSKPSEPIASPQLSEESRKKGSAGLDILNKCVEIDILALSTNQYFKFKHPLLLAYFAGNYLLTAQPEYEVVSSTPILSAALGFAVSNQRESSWVTALLADTAKDLLLRKTLLLAKWLKFTTKENNWRNDLLKLLITYVQDETLALPLRFRCFSAICSCNDPGLNWIFKKLADSKQYLTRHFGVLGLGAVYDKNNLSLLQTTLNDPSDLVRYAAVISIGMLQDPTTSAILRELITTSSDETMRRIAAEVLSTSSPDAESDLIEFSSSNDILTRRAVVFGLAVLSSETAREKLHDLSSSDPEWIIRATAARVLEYQNDASYAIPRPLTAFASAEWLLKFAASRGEGISPQVVPIDIFLQALLSKDADLEWNALNYLRSYPEKEVIRALVKLYTNPTSTSVGTIRAVDYNLWLYSASKN